MSGISGTGAFGANEENNEHGFMIDRTVRCNIRRLACRTALTEDEVPPK